MPGGLQSLNGPAGDFPFGLQGLVFDVDGVMLDSRTSNMEYYNIIRRAVGLPPMSRDQEDYCHMASVDQAIAHIIPEEYREAAEKACRAINYQEQILPLLSLEPGLLETLHWLGVWNVRLAVFTNRTNSVEALLRYFGLESFFFPVMTAGKCPPKPNPEGLLEILREWDMAPRQIAFLGDSRVDEQAAASAGVPFWAFRNPSLGADLHFDGFFKMISLITPLVEGR